MSCCSKPSATGRCHTTAARKIVRLAPTFAEYVASGRYHHRGYTIAGGSSEVQHNIIAKQVLGL